jgi:hypothetical protein
VKRRLTLAVLTMLVTSPVWSAAPAFAQAPAASPSPSPAPSEITLANRAPFAVQTQLGAMVVTTSDTGTGLTPTLWADADGPLVFGTTSIGRVGARIGLTGTPGQAFDGTDATNYKGVEVDLSVGRVVGVLDDIRTSVIAEYGFTTLVKTGTQARPKNGLVHSFGVGFAFDSKDAQLVIEGGFDEATTKCAPPLMCVGLHSGFAFLLYGHVPILGGKVLFGGDVSITPSASVAGVERNNIERVFTVVDPVLLFKHDTPPPTAAAPRSAALRIADKLRAERAIKGKP